MSAPITEAHRKLRETLEIRWMRATESEIEQLIADSEAAAVQSAMLREYGNLCATNESLAKERDRLRADRYHNHKCINRLASATGTLGEKSEKVVEVALSTIDRLRAEITRLDAEKPWLKEANATNAELRAELERLTKQAVFDGDHIHTLNAAFATRAEVTDANARAERAEAEVERLKPYVSKAILTKDGTMLCSPMVGTKFNEMQARAERAEAELAAERARLDWVELRAPKCWGLIDAQMLAAKTETIRAAIDAAMKEDK